MSKIVVVVIAKLVLLSEFSNVFILCKHDTGIGYYHVDAEVIDFRRKTLAAPRSYLNISACNALSKAQGQLAH